MAAVTPGRVISDVELASGYEAMLDEIEQANAPYLVTRQGELRLVILSLDDYESLIDAALAESDPLRHRVAEAKAHYAAGLGGSYECCLA
ncbi:MAG: type II toxin-antitoxin system Phd/YefM family antitoxin [Anaerolineae bacterium]